MPRLFVLFEHAAGYALFKTLKFDDNDQFLIDIQQSVHDLSEFTNHVGLVSFQPFRAGKDALENMNSVSEGILHSHLQEFLDSNLPKKKRNNVTLGVSEPKLASAIAESLGISCLTTGPVLELVRGIRFYFHNLVEGFSDASDAAKAQLGLGHHYSRARVKFNVNRIDNMIIQSISLLDQMDKDINTFTMRVREWYSHHFPELIKIVPENALYLQCVCAIKDRKELSEDIEHKLANILNDESKAEKIIEVSRNSMGMDISAIDLDNVYSFAERTMSLAERRVEITAYLQSKMSSVAPNLATLIGDTIGARLISRAGSLTNLAKYPASTIQILGAEKALFRALKTRGNTPKYGLIFHSGFISKAAKNDKGKISRFLASKCSIASRIDCFRDNPTNIFGKKLRQQVEDRLKFFESGDIPEKNIDVMTEALNEAEIADRSMKKDKKKKKRKLDESGMDSSFCSETSQAADDLGNVSMVDESGSIKKKKKKKKRVHEELGEESFNGTLEMPMDSEELIFNSAEKKKKKKKRKSLLEE